MTAREPVKSGYRLGDQQHAAGRDGAAGGAQHRQGRRVVMVEDDADKGYEIGALRQGVLEEVAAECGGAGAKAMLGEARDGAFGDGRQVEQRQVQRGRACRGGDEEAAIAAADVEQTRMAAEIVGVENVLGDQRLRGRHQRRIAGDARIVDGAGIVRPRIGPIGAEPRRAPPPRSSATGSRRSS